MIDYTKMSTSELFEERDSLKRRGQEVNSILMDRFKGESKESAVIPTRPSCPIQTIKVKHSVSIVIEDGIVTKFSDCVKSSDSELLFEYAESQEVLKPESIKLIYDHTRNIAVFSKGEMVGWKLDGKELL